MIQHTIQTLLYPERFDAFFLSITDVRYNVVKGFAPGERAPIMEKTGALWVLLNVPL